MICVPNNDNCIWRIRYSYEIPTLFDILDIEIVIKDWVAGTNL